MASLLKDMSLSRPLRHYIGVGLCDHGMQNGRNVTSEARSSKTARLLPLSLSPALVEASYHVVSSLMERFIW